MNTLVKIEFYLTFEASNLLSDDSFEILSKIIRGVVSQFCQVENCEVIFNTILGAPAPGQVKTRLEITIPQSVRYPKNLEQTLQGVLWSLRERDDFKPFFLNRDVTDQNKWKIAVSQK